VPILFVPYHLDEYQAELRAALPPGTDATEVTAHLPPGADVWARLAALYETVAREVAHADEKVVVSGDCTITIGMAAGLQRAGLDPAIVWCDAHGDVQTLETTSSGYLGGMALRLLMGYRADLLGERIGLRPPPEERVVLVDARDLDPPEAEYLASSRVRHVSVAELPSIELPPGPILLNLDLDIIDPAELPGLRYPAPGGPGIPAILQAARTIRATGRVAAVNIACTWDSSRPDPDGARQRVLSELLA
jgi:arginase